MKSFFHLFKCPKCGNKTHAIDVIPMCKCSGSSNKTTMEKIRMEGETDEEFAR